MGDFGVYGLRERESSWGRKRGEVNVVLTCGNSHTATYSTSGPDYPEENPEYPGKSGVSGFKPRVSGFS